MKKSQIEALAAFLKSDKDQIKCITSHMYYCNHAMYTVMSQKEAIAYFLKIPKNALIPFLNGKCAPIYYMYQGKTYSLEDIKKIFKKFTLQDNCVIFSQKDSQAVIIKAYKKLYNKQISRQEAMSYTYRKLYGKKEKTCSRKEKKN